MACSTETLHVCDVRVRLVVDERGEVRDVARAQRTDLLPSGPASRRAIAAFLRSQREGGRDG